MHQNRPHPPHPLPGFSWLKICAILALLLALLLTVMLAFSIWARLQPKNKAKYRQTRVTLHNLLLKIEEYTAENNGIYPVSEDGSSAVLYRVLSGDPSGLGQPPTATVYWEALNDPKNKALVGILNGQRVILDGFGNPIHYRSALDKNQKPVKDINNEQDFDLWSVGPDGEPSDLNTAGTFTSEETKDDIWE